MAELPIPMKFAILFLLVSFAVMIVEALYLVNLNSKPSMAMMHHHGGPLIVGAAGHDDRGADEGHAHAEEEAGHDDDADDAHDHGAEDDPAGMHGHGEEPVQEDPAEEGHGEESPAEEAEAGNEGHSH